MSCIASTYDASGKLVGCTEQELNGIVSMQLYTVIALGAGLYAYKTFTAENWVDIALEIGWGCVSAFTHTKRFTMRHIAPVLQGAFTYLTEMNIGELNSNSVSGSNSEDDHCYVRVIKDGVEVQGHCSIFGLIDRLTEHVEGPPESDSDDVVDINLNDENTEKGNYADADNANEKNKEDEEDEEENEEENDEEDDEEENEEDIREQISKIENHTMQFDFVLCQVPTATTASSDNPMCMHVMKYDGFPREVDGSYFFDRKFVPVGHRMMEIVLHHGDSEYEINLSSPDNFYVLGNKLLDPAFLKWFVRKNHGVSLTLKRGDPSECNYTIKCIDNNAALHTLQPCNYLTVCENGFAVHDSGLV